MEVVKIFADNETRTVFDIEKYQETGTMLVNEINALKPELVLDLGCGLNIYKDLINNIVGVDVVANERVDNVCAIEDLEYSDHCADVCLCLGSINFGNMDTVSTQIDKVVKLTKPNGRIYMRVLEETDTPGYFNWDIGKINHFTLKHNLQFITPPKKIYKTTAQQRNTVNRNSERLFWIWNTQVKI